jgi:hypothetical protein
VDIVHETFRGFREIPCDHECPGGSHVRRITAQVELDSSNSFRECHGTVQLLRKSAKRPHSWGLLQGKYAVVYNGYHSK